MENITKVTITIILVILAVLILGMSNGQHAGDVYTDDHTHDTYGVGSEMIVHSGPMLFQKMIHIYFDLIAAFILLFMAWRIRTGAMKLIFVILGLSILISFASVFSMRELMWAAPLVHSVGALSAGLVLFILITSPQNRALFRALRIKKRSLKSKKQKKKN